MSHFLGGKMQEDTILTSTAKLSISGTTLLITPDVVISPNNEQRVKIKITQSVPAAGANLAIGITFGENEFAVFDRFGNIVYGNELFEGIVLRGYFGNNGAAASGHYQLIKLPCRCY